MDNGSGAIKRTGAMIKHGMSKFASGIANSTSYVFTKVEEQLDMTWASTHLQEDSTMDDQLREQMSAANEEARRKYDMEAQANFFSNYGDDERAPMVVTASTRTHPDSILRRLGIIEQARALGKWCKKEPYTWIPRHGTWRPTGSKIDEHLPDSHVEDSFQTSLYDNGPSAVILVVGSIELDMPDVVAAEKVLHEDDNQTNEPQFGTATKSSQDVSNEELLTNIEKQFSRFNRDTGEEEEGLNEQDQRGFIMQYLSRAIPQAAHGTGALIVCANGDGAVAAHIGVGVASMQGLRTRERADIKVRALAVTPYSTSDGLPLCHHMTHHIVLRRCTRSSRKRCQGFQPKEEDGTVCGWCGLPKRQHVVPYLDKAHVIRKKEHMVVSEEPTKFETDHYISKVVDQLATGHQQGLHVAGRNFRHPQHLPAASVCVVLIGGDELTTRQQLVQYIQRKYTILVVEGSGGYADVLCRIKRRIESAFPGSGREKVRQLTTALDPMTAEILCSPDQLRIIKSGSKNEAVVREIEGSLKGDRALLNAWRTFSLWRHNANTQKTLHLHNNISLLALNVITTFITVLQTFLILRFKADGQGIPPTIPEPADDRGDGLRVIWTLLQWSVIILPICISLVQGISNQWNYGAKWVELRTSAERLLSEIYQYRTASGMYKDEEVERHRKSGTGKDAEGSKYVSREDLLQQRAHGLTELLLAGHCRKLTLDPGPAAVPPREILKYDDGFSLLQPDQYVRVRLKSAIQNYSDDGAFADRVVTSLRIAGYVMSALGTTFAAIAAYFDGSFQSWVAFTTALLNAFTRALEFSRAEFMLKKYNTTVMQLRNVAAWWASLGHEADTTENRDLLVSQVEGLVMDEVDAWAQQTHVAMEQMNKDAKAGSSGGSNKSQEAENQVEEHAMKELGFEELSQDQVLKMMSDPLQLEEMGDATKKKLQALSKKIAGERGGETEERKRERERMDLLKRSAQAELVHSEAMGAKKGETMSAIRKVHFSPFGVHTLNVDPSIFMDNTIRDAFLKQLLNAPDGGLLKYSADSITAARRVGYQHIMKAASTVPHLASMFSDMGHLQVLLACKKFALEELFKEFINANAEMELRWDSLFSNRDHVEEFLSEFANIASTNMVAQMSAGQVMNLVQDHDIHVHLMTLGKKYKSNSHKIISTLRETASSVLTRRCPVFVLLDVLCDRVAELDIDKVMTHTTYAVHLSTSLEQMQRFHVHFSLLPKRDLVAKFPKELQPVVADKSQMITERYLSFVFQRRMALRTVSAFSLEYTSYIPADLAKMISRREQQLRFVTAAESVTQIDILQLSKPTLIRRMRASPLFTAAIEEILMKMEDRHLRLILSAIQAKNNSTYTSDVIDRVADHIVSFDLRMLTDFENAARLVAKVGDIALVSKVNERSKEELLTVVGFRCLAEKLDTLSKPQLQELFNKMKNTSTVSWAVVAQMTEVARQCDGIFGKNATPTNAEVISMWDAHTVQRMLWLATSLSPRMITRQPRRLADEKNKTPFFLRTAGDDVLLQAFRHMDPSDTRKVFLALHRVTRDWELLRVFERVLEQPLFPDNDFEGLKAISSSWRARIKIVRAVEGILGQEEKILAEHADSAAITKIMLDQLRKVEAESMDETVSIDMPSDDSSDDDMTSSTLAAARPPRDVVEEEEEIIETEEVFDSIVGAFEHMISTSPTAMSSVKSFFMNIFLELVLSSPKRIFYRLVKICRSFDLREIFSTLEERADLVTLLCLGLEGAEEGTSVIKFDKQVYSDFDELVELGMLRLPKDNPDGQYAKGKWKKETLSALSKQYDDAGYAASLTKLHLFSEAQLRFLCNATRKVLRTPIGTWFAKMVGCYKKAHGSLLLGSNLPVLQERFGFDAAIYGLRSRAVQEPEKVRTGLDRMDAAKFEGRNKQEKRRALARLMHVGSDGPLSVLAETKDSQVYERLFAVLRLSMPPEIAIGCTPAAERSVEAEALLHHLLNQK